MKTEFSNFTVLVLNQSSISAVPLIVQCPKDQKTALMGDPLIDKLLSRKNVSSIKIYTITLQNTIFVNVQTYVLHMHTMSYKIYVTTMSTMKR